MYQENLRIIYEADSNSDDYRDEVEPAIQKIKELNEMGLISEEQLNHAYVIDMVRYSEKGYVKEALEDLGKRTKNSPDDVYKKGLTEINTTNKEIAERNCKILLFASVVKKEDANWKIACNRNNTPAQRNHSLSLVPNPLIAAWNSRSLKEEDVERIIQFYDSYVKVPQVKAALSKELKTLGDIFGREEMCDRLAGVVSALPLDYLNLKQEEMAALTQTSGNLGTSNSDQYEAVRKAVLTLNRQRLPGTREYPDGREFTELYKACSNYLLSHDSAPGSPNGRLRYNTVADVMTKIAIPMMCSMPEATDQINRDVFLNMVRNKQFRDHMVDAARQSLEGLKDKELNEEEKKLFGICAEFIKSGEELDKALAHTKHHMVTGKIKTQDDYYKLFQQYEQIWKTASDYAQSVGNPENEIGKLTEAGRDVAQRQ